MYQCMAQDVIAVSSRYRVVSSQTQALWVFVLMQSLFCCCCGGRIMQSLIKLYVLWLLWVASVKMIA